MRFKEYQPYLAPGYFKDDEHKNKFEEASGQMKAVIEVISNKK